MEFKRMIMNGKEYIIHNETGELIGINSINFLWCKYCKSKYH